MNDNTKNTQEDRRMKLAEIHNRAAQGPSQKGAAKSPGHDAGSGGQKGPRINPVEAMLILLVSLIFDGAKFLFGLIVIGIVINPVISFFSWLTFFLWYHAKGMDYGTSIKSGASAFKSPMVINSAGLLSGIIPIWNMLPNITAGNLIIIGLEYAESIAKRVSGVSKILQRLEGVKGAT